MKKANFNNIHALRTIIESTENVTFKGILEDILAGVEAGENMYTTMEYYSDVFPYIYINMIKVGELSGSLENSLEQAVKYLDSTAKFNKKIKKYFNTKFSSICIFDSNVNCGIISCNTCNPKCI